MRILLAYYSRTNSTRALALAIQGELEKRGHSIDIEEIKAKNEHNFWYWFFLRFFKGECEIQEPKIKDVSKYDAILIGSPNWTRLSLPMARYLKEAAGLEFKNTFLFSTTALWPWFEWYIFSAYLLDVTFNKIVSKKKGRAMESIMVSSIFKKKWGTNSLYGKNKIQELGDNIEHPPVSFKEFSIKQNEIEKSRFLITFFLCLLFFSAIIQFVFKIIIFPEQKFFIFWLVNFFTLSTLVFILQKKWRVYLIKYISAFFLILSLTLPHLIFHRLMEKTVIFSEISFSYILALVFISFWREYKIVLLAGAFSLLGYYLLFLSFLNGDSYAFTPFFDVSVIVLITAIISFIIRHANKYYLNLLENMDDLERKSRELEKTAGNLKMEKALLEDLKENLEEMVKKRTEELQKKVDELERFHNLTVGRELKMMELKKEIEKLKK
ncbi:MAG: hypothetical protein HY773_01740 [Candidatus Terrybacteria bacterium]|nr:hypothetical protein [Candidatus Terrybacteria bacterium]